MCLSTAYKTDEPDSIIMEYVSKIEVDGSLITLTDVLGDTKSTVRSRSSHILMIDNNCIVFSAVVRDRKIMMWR